jgi:hypothetical protein
MLLGDVRQCQELGYPDDWITKIGNDVSVSASSRSFELRGSLLTGRGSRRWCGTITQNLPALRATRIDPVNGPAS